MIDRVYVENGVGRHVTDAINVFTATTGVSATFQHDVHPAMQIAQQGDEWWIEEATRAGFAILTQDKAILAPGPERETLKACGGTLFALARADYKVLEKFGVFALNWSAVEAMLKASGPRAMVLQKGGHAIKLL